MIEELMAKFEKQQGNLKETLENLTVEVKLEGLTIYGNAAKKIEGIEISNDLLQNNDKEMLEDLLLVGFNRFIEQALKSESEITQTSINEMLPPGFGDLFK